MTPELPPVSGSLFATQSARSLLQKEKCIQARSAESYPMAAKIKQTPYFWGNMPPAVHRAAQLMYLLAKSHERCHLT
jgi:hypothetical protein